MVGLFSRISGGRSGHRRTQSAIDARQTRTLNAAVESSTLPGTATHGLEVVLEFKPVERPIEPLNRDQPVNCPLSEPSILNDGRIWKERMSANARARADLSVVEEDLHSESGTSRTKQQISSAKHAMLPSHSAPEYNLINLLEECNAAGI